MKTVEMPMRRASGTRVQLAELLAVVPENDWVWSILEFNGVGEMPSDIPFMEFRKMLRELPVGLTLKWDELLKFARSLEYTIDCLIVGAVSIAKLNADELWADNFQGCEVALEAIDGGIWLLGAEQPALFNELKAAASGT